MIDHAPAGAADDRYLDARAGRLREVLFRQDRQHLAGDVLFVQFEDRVNHARHACVALTVCRRDGQQR